MPLKASKGNMYDWVTHMHSHLAGECSHKCSYCYVQRNRFGVSPRYKGQVRLVESELTVNYGFGKTIFIEHMNDLFADAVPAELIKEILFHCRRFPGNRYIFQTKNPFRVLEFEGWLPKNHSIGTTIETNRTTHCSKAPHPAARAGGITQLSRLGHNTFITIEPIMDFDNELTDWIILAVPDFINLGADSKYSGLPEPSADKIHAFIKSIQSAGVPILKKMNLQRIIKRAK